MGSVFTEDTVLGKQTYIIGFTSYEVTAGRLFSGKPYKIDAPKSNSFENWINNGLNYAFVDFNKYNISNNIDEEFYMSGAINGSWYHKNHKAIWNKIFDGVFFIKKMYPCELIK